MAKGGYKGSSPARETSPEDYSGVWDIVEQYGEQKAGSWPFQADDCAPKSLRFNSADQASLETTIPNITTFSFSFWYKHVSLTRNDIFVTDASYGFFFYQHTDGRFKVNNNNTILFESNGYYRDPSAWYHCLLTNDGTTLKLYVNGVLDKAQTVGTFLNAGGLYIGRDRGSANNYGDFYLAELNFIDGQALEPIDFGFYDGQGIWQPKRFTGDYSSGLVYSNDVTGTGISSTVSNLFDGSTSTAVDGTAATVITFTPFTPIPYSSSVEVYTASSQTVRTYSLNGGSGVTNAANDWTSLATGSGTITSISQTPNSGYTHSWSAIRVDGQILTDAAIGRNSFHLDFSQDVVGEVKDQSGLRNDWTANNLGGPVKGLLSDIVVSGPSHVTLASAEYWKMMNGNKDDFAYAHSNNATNYIEWTPTGGYPTNGHIWIQGGDGNGNGTTGMTVQINGSTVSHSSVVDNETYTQAGYGWGDWHKYAVAGNTLTSLRLTGAYALIRQLSTVDDPTHSALGISDDNDVPAIVDTRSADTDYFLDSPVNANEVSTGAGSERRGNYCSLNPLDRQQTNGTLSNGNLDIKQTSSSWAMYRGTIFVSSGKYYWECTLGNNQYSTVGICTDEYSMASATNAWVNHSAEMFGYYPYNGYKYNGSSGVSYATADTSASGSVIGVALDMDNGTLAFYKDGTSLGTAYTGLTGKNVSPTHWLYNQNNADSYNFGQRSFSYNAPSGFSPLATSFLPEPSGLALNPSKAFDILLWSGAGQNSDRTISGIDMESGPDMVWSKTRNHGYHNNIFDAVRGFGVSGGLPLTTDYVSGQANAGVIKSTDSTSITWEKDSGNGYVWYNESGRTYVSWLWDAGTATTTIAAGGSNTLAYNQTQTWSGNISTTGNSGTFHSSFPATNAFNNNDANYAHGNGDGSQTAVVTFTLSPGVSCSNTVTFIGGMTPNGTATISVNGGTAVNLTSGSSATTRTNVSFSGTVTSIVITKTSSDASGMLIYGFEIDGTRLVDNGVSVTNVPEVECKVRANPEAGFSIVKVDNPTSTETRVHGLSKAPDFIIAKATASNNTQHYHMFHSHFGKSHYAVFNSDGWSSSDQWGSKEPDATSFYVKSNTGSGANYAGGMIYYIWHAVENYSAMSSYVGNGSNDGPMINLGWEPKWVMIKGTGSSRDWRIYDAVREPLNVKQRSLHASTSNTETHFGSDDFDFLSNGFKIRSSGSFHNSQDHTYVYVAFAANPFGSNIRAH